MPNARWTPCRDARAAYEGSPRNAGCRSHTPRSACAWARAEARSRTAARAMSSANAPRRDRAAFFLPSHRTARTHSRAAFSRSRCLRCPIDRLVRAIRSLPAPAIPSAPEILSAPARRPRHCISSSLVATRRARRRGHRAGGATACCVWSSAMHQPRGRRGAGGDEPCGWFACASRHARSRSARRRRPPRKC